MSPPATNDLPHVMVRVLLAHLGMSNRRFWNVCIMHAVIACACYDLEYVPVADDQEAPREIEGGQGDALGAEGDGDAPVALPAPRPPVQIAACNFSGCFNPEAFRELGVAEAWAQLGSEDGPCIRCHFNGYGNFIASDESDRVFEIIASDLRFMRPYFRFDQTNPEEPRAEVNFALLRNVGAGQGPYLTHPRYAQHGPAYQRLEQYLERVEARMAEGTCDAPRIANCEE